MSKWKVWVQWEIEVEAEDEGQALDEADQKFNFHSESRAEDENAVDEVWNSEKQCWEDA